MSFQRHAAFGYKNFAGYIIFALCLRLKRYDHIVREIQYLQEDTMAGNIIEYLRDIKDTKLRENIEEMISDQQQIETDYLKARQNRTLTMAQERDFRKNYSASLELISQSIPDDNGLKEYYEMQNYAFNKGWSIGDMPLICSMVGVARSVREKETDPAVLERVDKIMNDLKTKQITTLADRNTLINDMAIFANGLNANQYSASKADLSMCIEDAIKRPIHYAEYPQDEELKRQAQLRGELDKDIAGVGRNEALRDDLKDRSMYGRSKDVSVYTKENDPKGERSLDRDYVLQKRNEDQLDTFIKNRGQETAGIRVSNREAMRRVFGEDVLDAADNVRTSPDKEDRTVNLHHSKGNQQLRERKNVLEIDLSGSGMYTREVDYHGQNGKLNGKNTPEWEEHLTGLFGGKVPIKGYEDRKNVRMKRELYKEDGVVYKKDRYCIPGPTPEFMGMLNVGNYRIGATTGMSRQIAEDFLTPVFEEWIRNPDTDPMEVNVNLTGYSRGAVSAGESLKAIKNWVSEHPQYSQFADKIRYDVILYDPVPGPDGRLVGYGSNDLRDRSGAESEEARRERENITVFQSLAVDHNIGFTPETVRGAGKYIFTTGDHRISQGITDRSQIAEADDGQAHKAGFYDMDSGEYYRGSGLRDLDNGLYIADEDQNLLRITSLGQLNSFFKEVKSKEGEKTNGGWMQSSRRDVLRDTAKKYFIDNTLDRSYESEHERKMMLEDQAEREKKFEKFRPNKSDRAKGLADLKDKYNWMKSQPSGSAEYKAARADFVKGCKASLEKMDINGSRSERRQVTELCDLMIGYEREMWYEKHGLTPSIARQNVSEAVNDKMMSAQNDRLRSISDIKGLIRQDQAAISEEIKKMNTTSKFTGDSKHYTRMKNAAEGIMKLNENSTMKQIKDAYKELDAATENYISKRSPGMFGKKDTGAKRLDIANNLQTRSRSSREIQGSLTSQLHESHTSLKDMERRLNVRIAEGMERKNAFIARRKNEGHKKLEVKDFIGKEKAPDVIRRSRTYEKKSPQLNRGKQK